MYLAGYKLLLSDINMKHVNALASSHVSTRMWGIILFPIPRLELSPAGLIPPELGKLAALTELDLANTHLSGKVIFTSFRMNAHVNGSLIYLLGCDSTYHNTESTAVLLFAGLVCSEPHVSGLSHGAAVEPIRETAR